MRADVGFVEIDLLESAPSNRYINPNREFINVSDVLMGSACLLSLQLGFEGFVTFTPKTRLRACYAERFGARDHHPCTSNMSRGS